MRGITITLASDLADLIETYLRGAMEGAWDMPEKDHAKLEKFCNKLREKIRTKRETP